MPPSAKPAAARAVAVERGERARRERREQLDERGRHEDASARARCARSRRQLPVIRSPSGREKTATSTETGIASARKATAKARLSPPSRPSAAARVRSGTTTIAEGLRGEHEHEVDAVGGEEAVRLGVAAELVREERARRRGRTATARLETPVRRRSDGARPRGRLGFGARPLMPRRTQTETIWSGPRKSLAQLRERVRPSSTRVVRCSSPERTASWARI